MRRRAFKLLEDIFNCATAIQRFTRGRSEAEYLADEMLLRAVEREFEIIGEAMTRMLREAPDVSQRISHAAAIVGFRNALAHGYDVIRHSEVWAIIHQDVPQLLAEVQTLMAEERARP